MPLYILYEPQSLEHCFRLSYPRKVPSFQKSFGKIKSSWLKAWEWKFGIECGRFASWGSQNQTGFSLLNLSQHGGWGVVPQGNFLQIEKLRGRNKKLSPTGPVYSSQLVPLPLADSKYTGTEIPLGIRGPWHFCIRSLKPKAGAFVQNVPEVGVVG